MSFHKCKLFYYNIIIANIVVIHLECIKVEFNVPKLIKKNVPYTLRLINFDYGTQFPVENFVFAFELLKSVMPRNEISVADVLSRTYTGDQYRGFSITNFSFNKDLIEMKIEFRREAHNTIFRVRYSSATTDSDKEAFFAKNNNDHVVYHQYIDMFLPYTITIRANPEPLAVASEDKDYFGNVLLVDKNGQLKCHASDGLPNPVPLFVNSNELNGALVSSVNSEVTLLTWMVQLNDHNKQILCRAGRDMNNITLKVYHYMTNVTTRPTINEKVPRDSEIKCIHLDGYPIPRTHWEFVSGPADAKKYFEFRDNNSMLIINSSAPLNSNWTFECSGSSNISHVVRKYLTNQAPIYPIKRTYNFIVTGPTELDVQSSSAGIITVIIILLLIVIAITLVGVFKRDSIRAFIGDKKRSGKRSKPSDKPIEPMYKYDGAKKKDPLLNGTDREDGTCYLEIVGTIESKSTYVEPIDRV